MTDDAQDAAAALLRGSDGSTLRAGNPKLDLSGDGFTDLLSGATAEEAPYGFASAGRCSSIRGMTGGNAQPSTLDPVAYASRPYARHDP